MAQRRNAQTYPTAPRQPTREGESLRADVQRMHRQLEAGAFAMDGQDIPFAFDAAGTGTVPHRLGRIPRGAALVHIPSAAAPDFFIVAWDRNGISVTANVGCSFILRLY